MSRHLLQAALCAYVLAGCAGLHPKPSVEMLDARTGLTVASLRSPIQLVLRGVMSPGKRPGFAYLGPVEWDRMGTFTQNLWVHLAPAPGQGLANIREPAALTLELDDGELALRAADAPGLAREPYPPPTPWGQSAYFSLTVGELRRLAASSKLALRCRTVDGSAVWFEAREDTRRVLDEYLQGRRLTGD